MRFRYCSKFSISLTQRYRTNLRAIVPNTDYFKLIILNSEHLFIIAMLRSNKIFVLVGGYTPPVEGGEVTPTGKEIFHRWYFQKEFLKIRKINERE